MNEKHRKAVYASIWTLLMVVACYLTVSIMSPTFAASQLSLESFLLTIEITLFIISLIILAIVLKLRKQFLQSLAPQTMATFPSIKLAKVKKAFFATLLTMLLASATYATVQLLVVRIPVVYKEPLEVWFSDETASGVWYPLHDKFGQEITLPTLDLSNGVFEVYLRAKNNGKKTIQLTVTIEALNKTSGEGCPFIGFNVTTWDRKTIITYDFQYVSFDIALEAGSEIYGIVTYFLDYDTAPPSANNLEIVWTLDRSKP